MTKQEASQLLRSVLRSAKMTWDEHAKLEEAIKTLEDLSVVENKKKSTS